MVKLTPFKSTQFRYAAYVIYEGQKIPVVLSLEDAASPDVLEITVMKLKAALDQLVIKVKEQDESTR